MERSAVRQLCAIAAVQVLVMATWFSASAVVPALRVEWALGTAGATWLTVSVQLGFVTGALMAAVLNLADRVPAHRLVAGCAVGAAVATAAVATVANGLAGAVPLRFVTGVALAGVYPTGLKLMTTWFDRGRGFALGVLVGALTLGSALPQLVSAFAALHWRAVLLVAAGSALVGAAIAAWFVRAGPLAAPTPPFQPRYVLVVLRTRGPRLANLGYFGHMWELYAMWTWLPAYLTASAATTGFPLPIGVAAFLAIGVAGVVGCLLGGRLGDRVGRARLAALAMMTSATCCFAAAVAFRGPPVLVLVVALVWGAAVIADSGLFSACTSQVVDPRYTGTALTTQTAIGFLLTVVTIHATPLIADRAGWPVAVALLGLGPAAGAVAMLRLAREMHPASR
jgi:MFS family permease